MTDNDLKRALISVSDKTGLLEFSRALVELGYGIVSTGGTYKELHENGIPLERVSDVTGFPEILDGRVKTLHPTIHAGILARTNDEHQQELKDRGIQRFHMVVVNLYPFEKVAAGEHSDVSELIENIDIGGPTLIRAAAKNHESVAVLVEPSQYKPVISELREKGELSLETRKRLAWEAFTRTAEYDAIISGTLRNALGIGEEFPERLVIPFRRIQALRYGENPYQKAAFYRDIFLTEPCIANSKKLKGKELSYNNILDMNATLEMVKDFDEPTAAIVKHMNPSGIASADNISEAFGKALGADPLSAYGGIVALNREVDANTANAMKKIFLDSIIAPSFHQDAMPILDKKKVMLLETGNLENVKKPNFDMKRVVGGILVQSRDLSTLDHSKLKTVSERAPTPEEMNDMLFAWKVVKHVTSNAIVLAKNAATVGIGAGQMSRVGSVEIAVKKAGGRAEGAIMASDAFFPFRDGVDAAGKAGVTAVIHPGGSIRDAEVLDAANEYGMAVVLTGMRCLRH
ncbi:MAG: bifunctional phosphoribosylaminoimidazolecarboxamide formyltransferase/IMP cyclohydrolase [Candidatus Thermoplasmatota archaeon]|nr:bifunctional phosphoribosylaminoimidazolecarboxamide formyltransferase/IMP cyclohydrolase [Euryarchaeota archaeon]MBU4031371.1 bifunctional phosphoribosylaminoimidazolecarboxamide formyltransferase/IMP cyclohydrolase [Candidatus Thermoplasmatota archaeon]MBU4070830.1 bifunctional phosphoribosylaminoimidazolecarboxamide formyltransferase/IMP cyclohydrolase [Candidatus Thermoplasmatota archaeon]MBU4143343.1 bifunctional phosphoribosylaminoimidazolecarboxamide formyltransferase/IMP cyclohydrolas